MPHVTRPIPDISCDMAVLFWSKVEFPESMIGCWNWGGRKGPQGYGMVTLYQSNYLAHRVAYKLYCGDPAPGLLLCHSCDNPSCVNPHHLWGGTQRENVLDMWRKGRNADHSGDNCIARKYPERVPRGESHGNAVLNESKVRLMRELSANGVAGLEIARRFGVSQFCAWSIIRKKSWKHVT